MNIAQRIKERGLTLDYVASRLTNRDGGTGISQPSMSSLINGNPSFARLKEIAGIIGISVSELVRDDTETPVVRCPHGGRELVITKAGGVEAAKG